MDGIIRYLAAFDKLAVRVEGIVQREGVGRAGLAEACILGDEFLTEGAGQGDEAGVVGGDIQLAGDAEGCFQIDDVGIFRWKAVETLVQCRESLGSIKLAAAVIVAHGVTEFDLPPVWQVPVRVLDQERPSGFVQWMGNDQGDNKVGIDNEHAADRLVTSGFNVLIDKPLRFLSGGGTTKLNRTGQGTRWRRHRQQAVRHDLDGFLGHGPAVAGSGGLELGMQCGRNIADENVRHGRMIAR